MATAHFSRTAYKGSSGSGMAGRRVAYITRTGEYSPAEARIKHQGLEAGSEKVREDLVYWRARNLPGWAQDDPIRYFSAAEQHTSAHQIAYEELKFSLPRELSRKEQMAAARDFLQTSFGDKHPYVWALHDPPAADGGRQPHVHVIWSARTMDEHERSPEQFFRRYNRQHPERGGAEKARAFSHFGAVKASRVLYTDVMNIHLEHAGHDARLHPDKLVDRGFDREPEPRALPSDSNAAKYRGELTETWQKVLYHRGIHGPERAAEQQQAQLDWTRRKIALGISRDMPLAQSLARIRGAREHAVTHAPARHHAHDLGEQAHALEQRIAGLERHVNDLHRELDIERMTEKRGLSRDQRAEHRVERLLASGKEHNLPRDLSAEMAVARLAHTLGHGMGLDDTPTPGIRVRLFGKERDREQDRGREHDRGMGLGF